MAASKDTVKIIRVRVTEGRTGLLFAESEDLQGLLVAEPDMASLWEKVPEAIQDHHRAMGASVIVKRATHRDPSHHTFAAIPEEMITREAARH